MYGFNKEADGWEATGATYNKPATNKKIKNCISKTKKLRVFTPQGSGNRQKKVGTNTAKIRKVSINQPGELSRNVGLHFAKSGSNTGVSEVGDYGHEACLDLPGAVLTNVMAQRWNIRSMVTRPLPIPEKASHNF